MKVWTTLVTFLFLPGAALAQEGVRKLEGPGQHSKYLTPNQLDRWLFFGEKGETIIAHVATREFDSVLELAAKGGVTAIIQPGGSVKDEEAIQMANKYKMAMVFTGVRHFRH